MRSSKWTALLLAFAMLLGLSPAVFAFDDVPADAYYAEAVAWALEQGMTTGASASGSRWYSVSSEAAQIMPVRSEAMEMTVFPRA